MPSVDAQFPIGGRNWCRARGNLQGARGLIKNWLMADVGKRGSTKRSTTPPSLSTRDDSMKGTASSGAPPVQPACDCQGRADVAVALCSEAAAWGSRGRFHTRSHHKTGQRVLRVAAANPTRAAPHMCNRRRQETYDAPCTPRRRGGKGRKSDHPRPIRRWPIPVSCQ